MLGLGTTAYAATGTISGTITPARITGSYTYGSGGHQIRVVLFGHESDTVTGSGSISKITKTEGVVNGAYTTASAGRNADTGYKYYLLNVFGDVDGEQTASSGDLRP